MLVDRCTYKVNFVHFKNQEIYYLIEVHTEGKDS